MDEAHDDHYYVKTERDLSAYILVFSCQWDIGERQQPVGLLQFLIRPEWPWENIVMNFVVRLSMTWYDAM